MKTKKNDEIQSRREFFKKAARGVLPIIGFTVLSSMPFINANATSTVGKGCEGCTGLCTGCTGCTSCAGWCEGTCLGCTGCSANCYGKTK